MMMTVFLCCKTFFIFLVCLYDRNDMDCMMVCDND